MSNKEIEKEIEEVIGLAVLLYEQLYPEFKEIQIKVELTDNLDLRHSVLRPDIAKEFLQKNVHSDDNGRMVPPDKVGKPFFILLNTTQIREYIRNQNLTWIGTIAHEFTHALDYFQMANKQGLEDYSPLEIDNYLFASWSEYHAKKIGYSFLRYISNKIKKQTEEEQIKDVVNNEWPIFIENYYTDYHSHLDDGIYQIYLTMHLLGRCSVWNDLYPQQFNEEMFADVFSNNPWLGHLYSFLRNHETVELIFPCLDEFHKILLGNWPER